MATRRKTTPQQKVVYVQKEDGQWHLDKRVPLALIFALIVQAMAALTWANSVSFRLETMARDYGAISSYNQRNQQVVQTTVESVERLALSVKVMAEALKDRAEDGYTRKDHGFFCYGLEANLKLAKIDLDLNCEYPNGGGFGSSDRKLGMSAEQAQRELEAIIEKQQKVKR